MDTLTPRYKAAVTALGLLLILYCLPTLVFLWYLWSLDGKAIDFDALIPRLVVNFSTGLQDTASSTGGDILSQFHRTLLPIATFIAGLIATTASRGRLVYWVISFVVLLLAIVFVTYLLALPVIASVDASRAVEVSAIKSLFSRMFDTLFSYILLFLGLSLSGGERQENDQTTAREQTNVEQS